MWHTAAAALTSLGFGFLPCLAEDDDDRARDRYFQRIATFPVYLNTDIEAETVAACDPPAAITMLGRSAFAASDTIRTIFRQSS